MIRVTGLFRYPIKSCAGIPLVQAELDARGITHDRVYYNRSALWDELGIGDEPEPLRYARRQGVNRK